MKLYLDNNYGNAFDLMIKIPRKGWYWFEGLYNDGIFDSAAPDFFDYVVFKEIL